MTINGAAHVSTREFTIRTGNDGYKQAGRIHVPDPAAVANLKRILAQQEQARPRRPASPQDAHIAGILQRAKERKRPLRQAQDKPAAPAEPQPEEKPKEQSMKTKSNNKQSMSELITTEIVAGWAKRIRDGESRNQVAKNNELGVSDYTVRRYLEMYGYHRTTGQPVEREEEQSSAAQEPVAPERPESAEAETAAPPAEKALAVASSSNGHPSASSATGSGTAVEVAADAAPPIDEQMASLRRLLAELPRGKGIKIHGKISIELEF